MITLKTNTYSLYQLEAVKYIPALGVLDQNQHTIKQFFKISVIEIHTIIHFAILKSRLFLIKKPL